MADNRGGVPPVAPSGANRPNRSDLQTPQATKGGEYGSATASLQAQSQMPVAGAPSVPPSSAGSGMAGMAPGQVPSLEDPSARPGEPLTAGLALGAGPGQSASMTAMPSNTDIGVLKGVYMSYGQNMPAGGEHLRRLIEWAEQNLA